MPVQLQPQLGAVIIMAVALVLILMHKRLGVL